MNSFDRRYVEKITAPFKGGGHDVASPKAHAASIGLAIKGASESVATELDSIDHRLGQVLVGLDQLKRIVDRLDKISTSIDAKDVTG